MNSDYEVTNRDRNKIVLYETKLWQIYIHVQTFTFTLNIIIQKPYDSPRGPKYLPYL